MKENKNNLEGHRARIKEKLLRSSDGDLFDYELLELILCYANPRKDVKPIAKKLLEEFKSFSAIMAESSETLEKFHGIGSSAIVLLKTIKETAVRMAKEEIAEKPILSSSSLLQKYLRTSMGSSPKELFRVLFLNKKNVIIKDELLSEGTIDQVAVYPREIVKKSILYDASAIIMVHNHPSGYAKPSIEDIELTKLTVASLIPLGIIVHDHIIITDKEYFSFKANKLL
jgi:DNA repair protein RadC